ncbi:MAG: hypothetical protein KA275_01005 [Chitinophagaceae bacterium]|nr:hypothetical protein [Chitinophagaceae bacterium]
MTKKIYYLILIAILCFFKTTFAQSKNENKNVIFSQLSIEEKNETFNNWMNESTSLSIPENISLELKSYYSQQNIPSAVILKAQAVLKPLYNINLSKQNKLDMCDYIYNTFDDYFIPKVILNKIKLSL